MINEVASNKLERKRKKTVIPRCDCSIHDIASGIVEYLIITPKFAVGYLLVTIPWMPTRRVIIILLLGMVHFHLIPRQTITLQLGLEV